MDEAKTESSGLSARESRLRSLLKAVSWRVLATLTTIAIAWAVLDDWRVAMKIGLVEVAAKMVVYYFHERAWAAVPMGRVRGWFGKVEK